MTTIKSFVDRLRKIGIEVGLVGNYPWVYLDTVNGKKVKGKFMANHGFTVFFQAIKIGEVDKITDIATIFKKIRETLDLSNKKQYINDDMKNGLRDATIGDIVYLEGMTSLANGGGEYPVADVRDRFDEVTGEKYRQLLVDGEWYDNRTGACKSRPNYMYYIEPINE